VSQMKQWGKEDSALNGEGGSPSGSVLRAIGEREEVGEDGVESVSLVEERIEVCSCCVCR